MSDNQNSSNKPKSTEEVVVDLLLKGTGLVVAAAGSYVAGTVGHRISEMRSRKKAKELSVEENNKDTSEM